MLWVWSQSAQLGRMNLLLLTVALVCASAIEGWGYHFIIWIRRVYRADVRAKRPALSFVSNVSTTTTISTAATCFVTVNPALTAITTCKRKRKRAIISDGKLSSCINQTRPSPTLFLDMDHLPEFEPSQVESGMDESLLEDSSSDERQGKFLQYWLTTTTTFTSTAITSTISVGSVFCTPFGATTCPGLG